MSRRLLVLGLCVSLASCAIDMPAVPLGDFANGDIARVASVLDDELQNGAEENLALVHNIRGQCDLMLGDTEGAFRHFGTAGRIMGNWSASGTETFAAVVGSESSKSYKGDPYEKSMNAFYLALCYLWRGEPDNARAALKRGILADAEVGDERYQADNPMLFWLAGRMSLLMGLPNDAETFFTEAEAANAFAQKQGSRGDVTGKLFSAPRAGNLVLLVECGLGPEKFADGRMDELARFRPRWHPAAGARVRLDGEDVGRTSVICDVDYQARTLGGTEMEGIRKGKAVFKTGALIAGETMLRIAVAQSFSGRRKDRDRARTNAIIGGGLMLFGVLTSTRADIRHWPTVPATVQALCLQTKPGAHDLTIEFLDDQGRVLADLRQEWSIEVAADSESYYLFRSLPGLDRLLSQ